MPFEKAITLISEFAPPVYLVLVVMLAVLGLPFLRPSVKKFLVEYVGNVDYTGNLSGESRDSTKPMVQQEKSLKVASAGFHG
jgi:hypothetical protein